MAGRTVQRGSHACVWFSRLGEFAHSLIVRGGMMKVSLPTLDGECYKEVVFQR